MLNELLSVLAWIGLYQPSMEVLNANSPASRMDVNATAMVDLSSRFMNTLVESYVSQDGQRVSYGALEASPFYRDDFAELGSLLRTLEPAALTDTQRRALFINLYNVLTVHSLLYMTSLPESTVSVPKFWERYAYRVGPHTLTLDDMEHGILRGNLAHPVSGRVMFAPANDPRRSLSVPLDNRIHAALNCGALSCPPLRAYTAEGLEEELAAAMSGLCGRAVTVAAGSRGALTINSIFQWFRVDFAQDEPGVLRWLAGCVGDESKRQALEEASRGQRSVSYEYDWTLNAM